VANQACRHPTGHQVPLALPRPVLPPPLSLPFTGRTRISAGEVQHAATRDVHHATQVVGNRQRTPRHSQAAIGCQAVDRVRAGGVLDRDAGAQGRDDRIVPGTGRRAQALVAPRGPGPPEAIGPGIRGEECAVFEVFAARPQCPDRKALGPGEEPHPALPEGEEPGRRHVNHARVERVRFRSHRRALPASMAFSAVQAAPPRWRVR
jgi:hypothetical protein